MIKFNENYYGCCVESGLREVRRVGGGFCSSLGKWMIWSRVVGLQMEIRGRVQDLFWKLSDMNNEYDRKRRIKVNVQVFVLSNQVENFCVYLFF